MAATNLGAYLIIASYNRGKWKELGPDQQREAHRRAELLFPEYGNPMAQSMGVLTPSSMLPVEEKGIALPDIGTLPIPGVLGVQMMRSFHSGIHTQIPNPLPDDRKEEVLSTIFEEFKNGGIYAPGVTADPDPGIGWVAVVEAAQFDAFVDHMGGREGPLWYMYDITVIPLNADRTTKDVYDFMTPVHWNS
jgi:hypothetical protein